MQVSLSEIKELFTEIECADLSENSAELISSGELDSVDIMALIAAAERKFGKAIDASFIKRESFESFAAVKEMIESALNA